MDTLFRRALSMLSTLLILFGLVLPAIPAVAKESNQYADWAVAEPTGLIAMSMTEGPTSTCSPAGYERSIIADSTLILPVECPDLRLLAPGDEGLAGTYHITYVGQGSTLIDFSSELDGVLFNEPHPVELTITDHLGKAYRPDKANQPVATLSAGQSITLTVTYRWSRDAGNDYQGNDGSIQMKIHSGKAQSGPNPDPDPKPGPDPNPGPDPKPGPDPQPIPTPDPQGQPQATTGKVVVRVLGDLLMDGSLVPIPNAVVSLTDDLSGTTGPDGLAVFDGLRFGTYTATATGLNPKTGTEPKTGSGQTQISAEEPVGQVTVLLSWSPTAAGPSSPPKAEPAEPPASPGGPAPVSPVPDNPDPNSQIPGAIRGRICAPREPGARILATNDAGQVMTTAVAATGRLGTWVAYQILDLPPGLWQLSLQNPGDELVSQEVRVEPGKAAQALDFTLACTGESASPLPDGAYYLFGALLVAAGLYLRRLGHAPKPAS